MLAARKEEHMVGRYKVTLLLDEEGRPVGALIEGGRITRPVYIAAREKARVRLPRRVVEFLAKHGFQVER